MSECNLISSEVVLSLSWLEFCPRPKVETSTRKIATLKRDKTDMLSPCDPVFLGKPSIAIIALPPLRQKSPKVLIADTLSPDLLAARPKKSRICVDQVLKSSNQAAYDLRKSFAGRFAGTDHAGNRRLKFKVCINCTCLDLTNAQRLTLFDSAI
jgi:hypothetical protein